jgi:hypothetical protein
MSPVPAQMWVGMGPVSPASRRGRGRAQSRCRCGRGEPGQAHLVLDLRVGVTSADLRSHGRLVVMPFAVVARPRCEVATAAAGLPSSRPFAAFALLRLRFAWLLSFSEAPRRTEAPLRRAFPGKGTPQRCRSVHCMRCLGPHRMPRAALRFRRRRISVSIRRVASGGLRCCTSPGTRRRSLAASSSSR